MDLIRLIENLKIMLDLENNLDKIVGPGRQPEEYLKDYQILVSSCKKRGLNRNFIDFYVEIHHIVPRCKGGTDDDENLTPLSMLEHIVAHALLYRSDEDDIRYKTSLACVLRTSGNKLNLDSYINSESLKSIVKDLLEEVKGTTTVCYSIEEDSEDIFIHKIYRSISLTGDDGFSINSIASILRGERSTNEHLGYLWLSLSKFKNEYKNSKELINEYNNRSDKLLSITPIFEDKRLVCFDPNKKLYKVYNSAKDSEKDGFQSLSVNAVVRGSKQTHGGYCWTTFKNINVIIDSEYSETTEINAKSFKVVAVDPSTGSIVKIYRSISSIKSFGVCGGIIKEINTGNTYNNCQWYSYDFMRLFRRQDLLDFEESNPIDDFQLYRYIEDHRIICSDMDDNIIYIYNNLIDVFKDGFSLSCVSRTLNGDKESYLGMKWVKFKEFEKPENIDSFYLLPEDIAIENKLEFFKNNKLILGIEKSVACIDPKTQDIIKIYPNILMAEKTDGLNSRQISAVLVGKQKTSRGLIWMRLADVINSFPKQYEQYSEERGDNNMKRWLQIYNKKLDKTVCVNPINLEILFIGNKNEIAKYSKRAGRIINSSLERSIPCRNLLWVSIENYPDKEKINEFENLLDKEKQFRKELLIRLMNNDYRTIIKTDKDFNILEIVFPKTKQLIIARRHIKSKTPTRDGFLWHNFHEFMTKNFKEIYDSGKKIPEVTVI